MGVNHWRVDAFGPVFCLWLSRFDSGAISEQRSSVELVALVCRPKKRKVVGADSKQQTGRCWQFN